VDVGQQGPEKDKPMNWIESERTVKALESIAKSLEKIANPLLAEQNTFSMEQLDEMCRKFNHDDS